MHLVTVFAQHKTLLKTRVLVSLFVFVVTFEHFIVKHFVMFILKGAIQMKLALLTYLKMQFLAQMTVFSVVAA